MRGNSPDASIEQWLHFKKQHAVCQRVRTYLKSETGNEEPALQKLPRVCARCGARLAAKGHAFRDGHSNQGHVLVYCPGCHQGLCWVDLWGEEFELTPVEGQRNFEALATTRSIQAARSLVQSYLAGEDAGHGWPCWVKRVCPKCGGALVCKIHAWVYRRKPTVRVNRRLLVYCPTCNRGIWWAYHFKHPPLRWKRVRTHKYRRPVPPPPPACIPSPLARDAAATPAPPAAHEQTAAK